MKSTNKVLSVIFSVPILLLLLNVSSCTKLVEVGGPVTSTNAANVYTSDATAIAVLTGLYAQISSTPFTSIGLPAISRFAGLSADELTLWSGAATGNIAFNTIQVFYYTDALYANAGVSYGYEFFSYNPIYTCNSVIEALSGSTSLTPAVNQQLLGEAKFMRALFYFYLVNLYGDVPLALSTDYKVNASLSRASKTRVYQQIISDLKDAQDKLNGGYVDASLLKFSSERVRPTKWTATALLARVYLYMEDWANAEGQSTGVINNNSLYNLVTLNNVFLKNSKEAIWQLQPVNAGWNTEDARLFIFPTPAGPTSTNPVYLSNFLLGSFETGDNRKSNWLNSLTAGGVTYYYPFKYKSATLGFSVSEYLMVFRLAEQYLIRAEARAQQGNIAGAQADLNTIRSRAGLPPTTASTQSALLTATLHERQVELFTEWGHRWLDLKRTKSVDSVMTIVTPQKGGIWNTNWQLYPLYYGDLQKDPNLIQNPGY